MKNLHRINPIFAALLIPVVVIIAAAVLLITRNNISGSTEQLPLKIFVENASALSGNTYLFSCSVDQQLAQNEVGRVLVVKSLTGEGKAAVFVPATILQNFEVGQRYNMQVQVKNNLLQVESLEKF